MDFYQKELSKITAILKENSKGMTVTDISHKMRTNRNSVAKYLDILLILGHVQMLTFGPAKVFFPSKRIPIKSLINFTSDSMILFDENLTITDVNQNLLNLLDLPEKSLQGESLKHTSLPLLNDQTTISHIKNALDGKSTETNQEIPHEHTNKIITIKHLPTAYDDGAPGVACIITDTTTQSQLKQENLQINLELQSILTSIQDMVFIINKEFTIVHISQKLTKILNLPEYKIIGKKCYELIHGTDSPPSHCPYKNDSTNLTQYHSYYEPYLKKTLEIKISPLLDNDGAILGSVNILKEKT